MTKLECAMTNPKSAEDRAKEIVKRYWEKELSGHQGAVIQIPDEDVKFVLLGIHEGLQMAAEQDRETCRHLPGSDSLFALECSAKDHEEAAQKIEVK